jgi:hypothetical protein
MQCANQNDTEETYDAEVVEVVDFFRPVAWYSSAGQTEDYRGRRERERLIPVSKHRPSAPGLTEIDFRKGILYEGRTLSVLEIFSLHLDRILGRFVPSKIRRRVFWDHYLVEVSNRILFAQYFFVHKAFQLMRQAEKEGGYKYSRVVRLRFDQIIFPVNDMEVVRPLCLWRQDLGSEFLRLGLGRPIDLHGLKDDEVLVFGHGHMHHYYYVNDQHFVVTGQGAVVLETFFQNLHNLIMDAIQRNQYPTDDATIEHLFAVFLSKKLLRLRRTDDFGYQGLFVRRYRSEEERSRVAGKSTAG